MLIAVKAQGAFSKILAGSITLTFFVYVFVNIGMVSGIFACSWRTFTLN